MNESSNQNIKKVVVYIHGLHGSFKEADNYSYLKDDYDVVGLDYQDGNPWEPKATIQNEFKRLTDGYDEVVVIANSIGAFYSYEYLSNFKIDKAFFISPVGDMYLLVKRMMQGSDISEEQLEQVGTITNKYHQTFTHEYNQYLKTRKDGWKVPTFILYGENDQLIKLEDINYFMDNHPNTHLIVKKGSEHRFHSEEEKQFIKNWIIENI